MPFSLLFLWNGIDKNNSNFLWGFSFVSLSHIWLLSLHPLTWLGIPWFVSLIISLIIWLSCSLFGGFLVFSWSLIGKFLFFKRNCLVQNKFELIANVAILAFIWALGEIFLSQTPFFWIGLGESLVPSDLYLAGLARWIGAPGLTIIQLMIGFWIFYIYKRCKKNLSINKILLNGICLISFLHIVGFVLIMPEHRVFDHPVSIWQTNIPTREKSFVSNEKMKQAFLNSQKIAISQNADLLLAPEGTLRSDFILETPSKIDSLIGGFRKDKRHLKSSLLFFKKGEKVHINFKDKYRLVPLGERIPKFLRISKRGLSSLGGIENGIKSRLFKFEKDFISPVAVAICYEISDGINIINAARNGSKVILSISNLDPYPPILQRQFLSLARLRSIENNRDMILAANTGPSGLIMNDGRIDKVFPSNVSDTKLVFPNFFSKKTFYTNFGIKPLFIVFIFFLLMKKLTY